MHLHHFLSFIFSLLTLNSSLQHQQHQQQGKTKGRLYIRIFCTIAYFRQNSQQLIVKKEEREKKREIGRIVVTVLNGFYIYYFTFDKLIFSLKFKFKILLQCG